MHRSNYITLSPKSGDNHSYVTDIGYKAMEKGKSLVFANGVYKFSKPLLFDNNEKFFSLNLLGGVSSHFTNSEQVVFDFGNSDYGIGYQLARSSTIRGIQIKGAGQFGIVIDPLAKNQNGSSAIAVKECMLDGFECGMVISPNGQTLNGENIHLHDSQIKNCKIGFATTHWQNKGNSVNRLVVWENVDVVLDGITYGQKVGVMPHIDIINVAGWSVKKLFQFEYQRCAVEVNKVFSESIHQIGEVSGAVTFRGCTFDAALDVIPEHHFKGRNVKFDRCVFSYYDNLNNKPFIMSRDSNHFTDCYSDIEFKEFGDGKNRYTNHMIHDKYLADA